MFLITFEIIIPLNNSLTHLFIHLHVSQEVKVRFAGSARCYIGTYASRSDAINASKMGQEYFDTIPYDNLSPKQIEELVISMRKRAYASFSNRQVHTRITNVEDVKLKKSLVQKTKAVTRLPDDRHTSKDTKRDAKETSRKRNLNALGAEDLPRGVSLSKSGKFVSAGAKYLLVSIFWLISNLILLLNSLQEVRLNYGGKNYYIGVLESKNDASTVAKLARTLKDTFNDKNPCPSPGKLEKNVCYIRQACQDKLRQLNETGGDKAGAQKTRKKLKSNTRDLPYGICCRPSGKFVSVLAICHYSLSST